MKRKIVVVLLAIFAISIIEIYYFGKSLWVPVYYKVAGRRTVKDVVDKYGASSERNLKTIFQSAEVEYPPSNLTLLAFKEEKKMEVWAPKQGHWVLVVTYPIKGSSGRLGPKLHEGDRQVPEGVYNIEGLNPNSRFHLSMKVGYPNAFDIKKAKDDGRTKLGGDIFIHGSSVSIGCLAMGDEVIEDLFILVHRVGFENVKIIIAPKDLRRFTPPVLSEPAWVSELYASIQARLAKFTN